MAGKFRSYADPRVVAQRALEQDHPTGETTTETAGGADPSPIALPENPEDLPAAVPIEEGGTPPNPTPPPDILQQLDSVSQSYFLMKERNPDASHEELMAMLAATYYGWGE